MRAQDNIQRRKKEKNMPYAFVAAAYALLALALYLVGAGAMEHTMDTTSRLFVEKGNDIISIFEGHAQIKPMPGHEAELQSMFEALDKHNILFATLVDGDGVILVHGDRALVGKKLIINGREADAGELKELGVSEQPRSAILNMNGENVFAVYRYFHPLGRPHENGRTPVIILGLDFAPYKRIKDQARQNAFMRGGVLFIVALGIFFFTLMGQRLRESRLERDAAEIKVRHLEAEVARKEKLAAVGTLAAGIAHEIRNPLSSIMGYAYYFSQKFSQGSEERKYAETISREVQRLNRVIGDLLCFARPAGLELKQCDIAEIVEHSLRLLRQDARKQGVEIIFNPPPGFPPAMLDADRFIQALLNICLNSMDAMPQGGTLTIALSRFNKENFALEVRDTGGGIAPEHLDRIFDPYFTTRGDGTGLGLPIVYKIVEAHGGQISVDSGPEVNGGKGAVFCLVLPFGKIPSEEKK